VSKKQLPMKFMLRVSKCFRIAAPIRGPFDGRDIISSAQEAAQSGASERELSIAADE
jgi:hypothetical protein